MAKKKNKKQHKTVSAVSTSDNTEKIRLERARRWAREYSKKIRASARDDLRFQDGLDYDEIRVKRRVSATVALLDEAKEKLYELCPDVPELFSFEEDWYEQNLLPRQLDCRHFRSIFCCSASTFSHVILYLSMFVWQCSKVHSRCRQIIIPRREEG